nr:hypothetical protein [Methanoregulaceae archaeon]
MSQRLHILITVAIITGFIFLPGCTSPPNPPSTITPTPPITPGNASDLTNQNAPDAATFSTYPSQTKLHTPDVPVGLKFVAGGFSAPMQVADPHDGSGRLFLVDQNGYVKIFFMNGTVLEQPFLDVRDRMVRIEPTYDERGLLAPAARDICTGY